MSKKLIITEKPSVARDFAKILGVSGNHDGYIENHEWVITWCVGHLVEMCYPEVYDEALKHWDMNDLPFLPPVYKYDVISEVKKQYDVVHHMLNRLDIDTVYWAGDAGREGQTIEENIRNFGGVRSGMKELRIWIDSQTEEEIKRGIKEAKPMSEYENLGKSGIMRAIEDYALGINFTRALSLKYGNAIHTKSAITVGRVMTVVLGMVVAREREIENFVPTDFYKIMSKINVDGADIIATWKAMPNSPLLTDGTLYNETGFRKKADAANFIESLGRNVVIENVTVKEIKKKAPLLFNLAELQATCSRLLHISPDETLAIAQSLYEKKLTTYPRTDARVLSSAVAKEIHMNLGGLKRYNSEIAGYVDAIFSHNAHSHIDGYIDDSKISDHYAIIPTGQAMNEASKLSGNEAAVFDLIVRRFVSIFLPAATYKKVSIVERDTVKGERFYANGSALIKPGYLQCTGIPNEKNSLPAEAESLVIGDTYAANYTIADGKTSPPSRYTSGSMVLAMENAGNLIEDEDLRAQIKSCGIGTSATRADTIKKLVKIEYINLNKKTQVLTPAPLGNAVYEIVKATVPELLVPEMTAKWEQGLELIKDGKLDVAKYEAKLNNYITTQVQKIKGVPVDSEVAKVAAGFIGTTGSSVPKPKKVTSADVETYLNVPFDEKDEAKALGARFDGKAWYVPKGKDTTPFAKWMSNGSMKSVKKIYLNVPFDDKDEAKALGARFDGGKKSWYIMSNMDKSKFAKWL